MKVYIIDMDNAGRHKYGFDVWADTGHVLLTTRTCAFALEYVDKMGYELIENLTLDQYNKKSC